MAYRPKLSLAVERYDRTQPLLDGRVSAEGVDLVSLAVPQRPGRRHERMLHYREFDACELSLSSYLMAKNRGEHFTAIPVFPRRLFSQSNIYVNKNAGINTPEDMIGKRVGLNTSYCAETSAITSSGKDSSIHFPLLSSNRNSILCMEPKEDDRQEEPCFG